MTGALGGEPSGERPAGDEPVKPCAWANEHSSRRGARHVRVTGERCVPRILEVVRAAEPRIAEAIADELDNQRHQLKLIASENYASPAVLLAMGNWLSDKYAEGTPGHRFYAGCEVVDRVEVIANEHARALFGADHAYVQPHSGIDANLVAFWAILAKRVESARLDALDVSHVNDLTPQDWEQLREDCTISG